MIEKARQEAGGGGHQDSVALVSGDEETLKRFFPEGKNVRLQPANHRMKPLQVPASNVRIQGIVVGLMRRF